MRRTRSAFWGLIFSLPLLQGCETFRKGSLYSVPTIERSVSEFGPSMQVRSNANLTILTKPDLSTFSKDIQFDESAASRFYRNYWCSLQLRNEVSDVYLDKYKEDSLTALEAHCREIGGDTQESTTGRGYWCNVGDSPAYFYSVEPEKNQRAPRCKTMAKPMYLEIQEPLHERASVRWEAFAIENGFRTEGVYNEKLRADRVAEKARNAQRHRDWLASEKLKSEKAEARRAYQVTSLRKKIGYPVCKLDGALDVTMGVLTHIDNDSGSMIVVKLEDKYRPTSVSADVLKERRNILSSNLPIYIPPGRVLRRTGWKPYTSTEDPLDWYSCGYSKDGGLVINGD